MIRRHVNPCAPLSVCCAVLSALLLAAATLRADSLDDAEAKKRGVTVEVVQLEKARTRISQLETENADLKKRCEDAQKALAQAESHSTAVPPQAATDSSLTEAQIAAWKTLFDKYRLKKIATLQARIKTEQEPASSAKLRADQKLLADLHSGKTKPLPPFDGKIEIGSMGLAGNIKVIRVRSGTEAMVRLLSRTQDVEIYTNPGVISDRNVPLPTGRTQSVNLDNFAPTDIVLSGVDCSKWADGHEYENQTCILIVGTRRVDGETLLSGVPLPLPK